MSDSDPEAVRVFDFDVYDYGTSDGLPTKVTQAVIHAGSNNDVDWSTQIAGAKLSIDGGSSFVTTGMPVIGASTITIPITSGNLDIADGDAETVSLFIFLENSGIVDNGTLEFQINDSGHGFTADASGSQFATTFPNAPTSNQILIDVEATALEFVQQPSNTGNNSEINPAVTVEATDANGNRDLDFDLGISITSTGSLSGSPVIQNAVTGLATFSNLVHTSPGSGLTLTAERNGTGDWDVVSNSFDILTVPSAGDVIITEILYNSAGSEPAEEWFEVYNNSGSKTFDLNGWKLKSGSVEETINTSIILAPGQYAVFGATSAGCGAENFIYGTSLQLSNSSDDVSIIYGATTIDIVDYQTSGAWPPSTNGKSIGLKDVSANNDDGANWCLAISSCGGDFGTPGTANDACTFISFDLDESSINETAGTHDIQLTLTEYSSPVNVSITVTGGTATPGNDFTLNTTSLTFSQNETKAVNLTINDDGMTEGNETIVLTVAVTSGSASLGTSVHTVTIIDNDIPSIADVRINEVDCSPSGSEFIELYGTPGFSLNGLVVVLFNGALNDGSYDAIDLDGHSLDANGYFIIGNAGVANGDPEVIISTIQDGVDGVGLYFASASDFPASTPATTANIIDQLVYDTGTDDDPGLRAALGFTSANGHTDQPINENQNNNAGGGDSVQRGSWFAAPRTPRAPNAPLPIELLEFKATRLQQKQVLLTWTTLTETQNQGFVIEKNNAGKWINIGWQEGAGTSLDVNNYTFTDPTPSPGPNYYRLKQVDYDGAYTYSRIVSVNFEVENKVSVFPNPVRDEVRIALPEKATSGTYIQLFDFTGRLLRSLETEPGQQDIPLFTGDLPAGVLQLKIQNGALFETHKIVKQ